MMIELKLQGVDRRFMVNPDHIISATALNDDECKIELTEYPYVLLVECSFDNLKKLLNHESN